MMSSSGNPFVFPGMAGDGSQTNPLMQSLDMMRQAWSHLTPAGAMPPHTNTQTLLDPGEIDRRIVELQAVENWLNLNLGMIQGSIRALEVQRATLSTLRSFATMGGGMTAAHGANPGGPSPLEVALGLKPAPEAPPAGAAPPPGGPTGAADPAAAEAPAGAANAATNPAAGFTDPAQAAAAQQAWWDMLQQQFNQIASAATTTFGSDNAGATSGKTAKQASPAGAAPARKAPRKAAAARKATGKRAAKTPKRQR